MATRHWGPVKAKSNKGRCLGRRHCSHSIHCNLITPHFIRLLKEDLNSNCNLRGISNSSLENLMTFRRRKQTDGSKALKRGIPWRLERKEEILVRKEIKLKEHRREAKRREPYIIEQQTVIHYIAI